MEVGKVHSFTRKASTSDGLCGIICSLVSRINKNASYKLIMISSCVYRWVVGLLIVVFVRESWGSLNLFTEQMEKKKKREKSRECKQSNESPLAQHACSDRQAITLALIANSDTPTCLLVASPAFLPHRTRRVIGVRAEGLIKITQNPANSGYIWRFLARSCGIA